jgi:hypothetical protein
MQYVLTIGGLGLVAILVFFFIRTEVRIRRERYVGYGWSLGWREGKVIVLSRFLDSPSGREQVRIGSCLLQHNGTAMEFESGEGFRNFMLSQPRPTLGELSTFRLKFGDEEKEVVLAAEMIQGPIPVYTFPSIDPSDAWKYRQGLLYCRRTGQMVPVLSPSDSLMDQLGR